MSLWSKLTLFLFAAASLISATQRNAQAQDGQHDGFAQLKVGVRFDAAPFSFRKSLETSENLDDYGGYVVEICREVIRDMASEQPFDQSEVVAVEVSANSRFDELLREGGIDILCGPASITENRVKSHLVSMPVYLTGVAMAHPVVRENPASSPFPHGSVCDRSLIGFVSNTTAEYPAASKMAGNKRFFRFSDVVLELLKLTPHPEETGYPLDFYNNLVGRRIENIDWSDVCDTTWTVPPIRVFSDHKQGLAALCKSEILFYLADVDIISQYLLENQGSCNVTLDRDVAFLEHYGIYFRKADVNDPRDIEKALILYASFSRSLVKRAYSGDGVFDRAFEIAFGKRERTPSLEQFFRSFSNLR